MMSSQDPWVEIVVGGQKALTKKHPGGGKAPNWGGQTFNFRVEGSKIVMGDMWCTIKTGGTFGQKTIGVSRVKLAPFASGKPIDTWFPVMHDNSRHGELRAAVRLTPPFTGAPAPAGAGSPFVPAPGGAGSGAVSAYPRSAYPAPAGAGGYPGAAAAASAYPGAAASAYPGGALCTPARAAEERVLCHAFAYRCFVAQVWRPTQRLRLNQQPIPR